MDNQVFVVLSQTTICFVALVALVVIWFSIEKKRHVKWWIISFGAAFLASLMSIFPVSSYPSEDFFYIVTSLLNIIIAVVTPYGFAVRAGLRIKYTLLSIPVVSLAIAFFIFSHFLPHAGMSTGLPYLVGALSLFINSYILLNFGTRNVPELGTATIFSVVAIANLVQFFIAFSQGEFVQPATIYALFNLSNIIQPAAFVVIAIFINLLIASDMAEKMKNLAMTDPMTGIFNRRGLLDSTEKVLSNLARSKRNACLVVCDIDHFKSVNDTYGHDVGDEVIKVFADTIKDCVRQKDFVGRVGGEEFVILLAETSLSEARAIAERIRVSVAPKTFHFGNHQVGFTASFGISSSGDYQYKYETLFKQADEALYKAKQGGRNQVQLATS